MTSFFPLPLLRNGRTSYEGAFVIRAGPQCDPCRYGVSRGSAAPLGVRVPWLWCARDPAAPSLPRESPTTYY